MASELSFIFHSVRTVRDDLNRELMSSRASLAAFEARVSLILIYEGLCKTCVTNELINHLITFWVAPWLQNGMNFFGSLCTTPTYDLYCSRFFAIARKN